MSTRKKHFTEEMGMSMAEAMIIASHMAFTNVLADAVQHEMISEEIAYAINAQYSIDLHTLLLGRSLDNGLPSESKIAFGDLNMENSGAELGRFLKKVADDIEKEYSL